MTKAVKTTGKILSFNKEYSFFVKRGDSKRIKNNSVDALSMYMEALERNPNDCDTRITVAEMLTTMGRFIESNNVIIPYMHTDARLSTEAYCIVGFNLMGMGWYLGAVDCLYTFLDRTEEVSERIDTVLDAIDAITQGMGSVSLDITDVTKENANAVCNVAKELVYKEKLKEAKMVIDTLIDRYPRDCQARRTAAWINFCLSDSSTAVGHINAALRENPTDIEALCMYLCFGNDRIEPDEIECICNKICKYSGEDLSIAMRICEALLVVEHSEQAIQLARRMCSVSPYECEPAHLLAQCYVCNGDFRKAINIYDRLLRINKNDIIARYYRQLYSSQENLDTAGIVSVRYVLPMNKLITEATRILGLSKAGKDKFTEEWQNDPSLEEYALMLINIGNSELGKSIFHAICKLEFRLTERFMRRILISDFVSTPLKDEVVAKMKLNKAAEPFYVISEHRLREGRVKTIRNDRSKMPMHYLNIYARCVQMMSDIYDEEVQAAGISIFERFISVTEFPSITEGQSAALSAAIEYLSCKQCGVAIRSDILERYDITQRRLLNAIRRIYDTIGEPEDSFE